MPVHEQRESESTHGAARNQTATLANEQSNYQAVASETIFLLRFLPPPRARGL